MPLQPRALDSEAAGAVPARSRLSLAARDTLRLGRADPVRYPMRYSAGPARAWQHPSQALGVRAARRRELCLHGSSCRAAHTRPG